MINFIFKNYQFILCLLMFLAVVCFDNSWRTTSYEVKNLSEQAYYNSGYSARYGRISQEMLNKLIKE